MTINLSGQKPPLESEILFNIGHYQVTGTIGKGGMGVVYLAYDPSCGRKIAIKKIREDFQNVQQVQERFLREAKIASQLTHPSIIPIYSIYTDGKDIYYTMPYIQGETLKEILKKAKIKKGRNKEHPFSTIPALIRILINICQAIAYAHTSQVLHRDIKPENIIIGHFGEVMLLDWGLAVIKGSVQEELKEGEIEESTQGITRIGKVVGTINYMAPERVTNKNATVQTDIYSLGVILYQMLTLRFPFKRISLKEFKDKIHKEKIADPQVAAPYRDIPRLLSKAALKCLEADPKKRYQTVDELIHDLENYIEGRAEWVLSASLDPKNRDDWEFQENVFLAEHVAVTVAAEVTDWMNLMISKMSFGDNVRIEAEIRLGSFSHGIGFLLSIPEPSERKHLNDGFCLWLGSVLNRSTKLLRSTVEVIHDPDVILKRHLWYKLKIDKIDDTIHFYLNDKLQFSYIGHLPLLGTHIGLISRDAEYDIKNFNVFVAGQSVTVNCLAVPDAFLAHKDYQSALSEYRRIGYSFPGRQEGREAMFRAGITLLEQAKNSPPEEQGNLFDLALTEFEKLYDTPGAPLEYLGKALVYQALSDYEEEVKCFELACRRYAHHPLISLVHDHLIYRMHDASRYLRRTTYEFILLTLCFVPNILDNKNALKLFHSLEKHWEPLPFLLPLPKRADLLLWKFNFTSIIAFWLEKTYILQEIGQDVVQMKTPSPTVTFNILSLLLQSSQNELEALLEKFGDTSDHELFAKALNLVKANDFEGVLHFDFKNEKRISKTLKAALYFLDALLLEGKNDVVLQTLNKIQVPLSEELGLLIDERKIWALLQKNEWEKAGRIFQKYPSEYLDREDCPLFSLYGCYLMKVKNHSSPILENTYPKTWTLLWHVVDNPAFCDLWLSRAFAYEARQLYRQMALYCHCLGDKKGERKWKKQLTQVV